MAVPQEKRIKYLKRAQLIEIQLLGVFLILFLVGMLPLEWFLVVVILFLLSIANTRIRLSS